MAKYGIGKNAVIRGSARPRQWDRHVLDCCEEGREQVVSKWSSKTGVCWLGQLCNEGGAHLRAET